MYANLKMLMALKGVTIEDLAKLLGVHRNTIANKLDGESEFSFDQAIMIHDRYFSEYRIKYVFARLTQESA